MMRAVRFAILLGVLTLLGIAATFRSGTVPAQAQNPTNTLDPLFAVATAFVRETTLTAAAFSAQSAPPLEAGTATPYESGLCHSMSYRVLSDVADEIESAMMVSPGFSTSAEVTVLEDTQDCITFAVRETDAQIDIRLFSTLDLYDEGRIGLFVGAITDSLRTTSLRNYPDVTLTVRFYVGRQSRSIEIDFRDDNEILNQFWESPIVFLDTLTNATETP